LPSAGVTRWTDGAGKSAALEQSLARPEPAGVRWVPIQSRARADGVLRASLGACGGAALMALAHRGAGSGDADRALAKSVTAQAHSKPTPFGSRIGVIADNHGYLDLAVLEVFAGVNHIIHAGDVMDPAILEQLAKVAPVTAVAGNMDAGQPTSALPREVVGEVAGVRFLVGHKRKRLLRDLAAGDIEGLAQGEVPDLVIYGHDHVPAAAWVEGTLYLDPGSATAPHEEDDDPTVAIVEVRSAGLAVTFVPLARRDAKEAKPKHDHGEATPLQSVVAGRRLLFHQRFGPKHDVLF